MRKHHFYLKKIFNDICKSKDINGSYSLFNLGHLVLTLEGTLVCHDNIVVCVLTFITKPSIETVLRTVMIKHLNYFK